MNKKKKKPRKKSPRIVIAFAERFEAARERLDLTVSDVAERSGIDKTTIYRAVVANGENLRMNTLMLICAAVDLDPRKCWANR